MLCLDLWCTDFSGSSLSHTVALRIFKAHWLLELDSLACRDDVALPSGGPMNVESSRPLCWSPFH